MTRQEVAALVALAVANFPHQQDRDITLTAALWLEGLSDLPFPIAKTAMLKVLATSRFWPTLADLREAAASINPPTTLPLPEQAWAEVVNAIRRYGYTHTPEWSHPAVGRAADAMYGGWVRLCQSCTMETIPADRAHYMRIYGGLTKTQREDALLPAPVKAVINELRMKLLPGGK